MKWPTKELRIRIKTAFGRLFRTDQSESQRSVDFFPTDSISSDSRDIRYNVRRHSLNNATTRRPKTYRHKDLSSFETDQDDILCVRSYDPTPEFRESISEQHKQRQQHHQQPIYLHKPNGCVNTNLMDFVTAKPNLLTKKDCRSMEFRREELDHCNYGDRIESAATVPDPRDTAPSPYSMMDVSNTLNDQNTLSFSKYTSSELAMSSKSSVRYRSDTLLASKPAKCCKHSLIPDVDSKGETQNYLRPSSGLPGLITSSPHNSVRFEYRAKSIKELGMQPPKQHWKYEEEKILSLARSAYVCVDPPEPANTGLNSKPCLKTHFDSGKESVLDGPNRKRFNTCLNDPKLKKAARESGDGQGRMSGAFLGVISPCHGLDQSPSSMSHSLLGSNYTSQTVDSSKPNLKHGAHPCRARQTYSYRHPGLRTQKPSSDHMKISQSIPDPGLNLTVGHAEMGVRLVGHTRDSDWKKHSFLNQNDRCGIRLQGSKSVSRVISVDKSVDYPVRGIQKRREYASRQRTKTVRGYSSLCGRQAEGYQRSLNRNQISKNSISDRVESDRVKGCSTTQLDQHRTNPGAEHDSSKNDRVSRRASCLTGALPPSKDLDLCPTGRHPNAKPDKPCLCSLVKRMVIAQSKPVLYAWHARNPNSDQQSGNVLDWQTPIPELANYHLARPTRMVRGGQGTVAWVSNTNTGLYYALKFKTRDGRSERTWKIERREAKLLRHTKHEFIVRLFHIYETEDTLFMSLEWLDGGCLWNHVARLGTMPESYALYYAACVLSALLYMHSKQIVYRDMKAENIVLDQMGRPKLIDFGMAKHFGMPEKPAQTEDNVKSTSSNSYDSDDFKQPPTRYYFAAYLAPEIYDHVECSNHLIDSWGLGYILIEMILGYGIFTPMPWENQPGQHLDARWKLILPSDTLSMLSQPCSDFLHRMLVRKPESRLSLKDAVEHQLFARIPWSNLNKIRGPDLSKCKSSEVNTNPSGSSNRTSGQTNSQKSHKVMVIHDSYGRLVDLAFFRDFGVFCTFQPRKSLGHTPTFNARTSKPHTYKLQKPTDSCHENRSLNTETEKFCHLTRRHGRNRSANSHSHLEKSGGGGSMRVCGIRASRTVRRPHISAT